MSRSSRSRTEASLRPGARRVARWVAESWSRAVRTARLTVGIPDYEAYAAHVRDRHPDRQPMDRAAFFLERTQARYGKGRVRCC